MPQFYTRKTNRATRTPHDLLIKAAELVSQGQSIRQTATDLKIDKMTLHRFLVKSRNSESFPKTSGYAAVAKAHYVFPSDLENELGDHIKLLSDMFFGLSLAKCRELAYEFAKKNNIKIPQSWHENGKAGMAWWAGFKRRQSLAIRSPEATSLGRATAFNPLMTDP